jgi:hypothetical protein
MRKLAVFSLVAALLAACGGGGGGGGGSSDVSLTVVKSAGMGTVVSTPSGINCNESCTTQTASFTPGSRVSLVATPAAAAGVAFSGWAGGGCSGTGTCSVLLSSSSTVTAGFAKQVALGPNTLGLFVVSSGGNSSQFLGFDSGGNGLTINTSVSLFSVIVPSANEWILLSSDSSVDFATSSILPFVQDDRVFLVKEFNSSKAFSMRELNLATNQLGTAFSLPGRLLMPQNFALVGNAVYYREETITDLFGTTTGGQFSVVPDFTAGSTATVLLPRTDADASATFDIGDKGNVYAVRRAGGHLQVWKRDLVTGHLVLPAIRDYVIDDTTYAWGAKINNGILYAVRRQIADKHFEVLASDLSLSQAQPPGLAPLVSYDFATQGDFLPNASTWGVDNGVLAFAIIPPGSTKRSDLAVVDSTTVAKTTQFYTLGTGTSIFGLSVLKTP